MNEQYRQLMDSVPLDTFVDDTNKNNSNDIVDMLMMFDDHKQNNSNIDDVKSDG